MSKAAKSVCVNCKHNTTGDHCEECKDGFYRPVNVPLDSPWVCRPCRCWGPGKTGKCYKDDTDIIEGIRPGDCICEEGYEGPNCERCALGYRGYPKCKPCPCDHRGIVNSNICGPPCVCKPNVDGIRCDRCAKNYYNLDVNNPEGCSECFCFGLTKKCKPSDWGAKLIKNMDGWLVTDLLGRRVIKPDKEPDGHLSVADDEFIGFDTYYWAAPQEYLGNKLYSYGGNLRFSISYVVGRGDVSGVFTEDADIILEGPQNVKIGYNWKKYSKEEDGKTTVILPLREQEWYRVSDDGKKSKKHVSREDFALVLNNLKRLLLRGKFHTEQVEGGLHDVDMQEASEDAGTDKKMRGMEQCSCPPGYDMKLIKLFTNITCKKIRITSNA